MRVFLVEASALVRERLQRVLVDYPCVQMLGSCDCAREAEGHAQRLRPDLIILDLSLREGNGFQLLRAISRWSFQPEVMVLTNDAGEPFRRAAYGLGVRHFYDKALEFEQAVDALVWMSTRWQAQPELES